MRRRSFIALTLYAPLALCAPRTYARFARIWEEPYATLAYLYRDLFAGSAIGAHLHRINVLGYLAGVMHDPRLSDHVRIRSGVERLHEWAKARHAQPYYHLDDDARREVLIAFAQSPFGSEYLHLLLGYFFEAMLGDPVYGGNIEQWGWSYLHHRAAQPRPSAPFDV